MKKTIAVLALLFMVALPVHSGETFNTWDRGYITVASCTTVAKVAGGVFVPRDMYAPVVGGDTIDVRGIMLGFQSAAHGQDHSLQVAWREPGADGWERWNEWINAGPLPASTTTNWPLIYGLPLPSRWQGLGGINGIGCTPFIPMSNPRMIRLYNPSAFGDMEVVVLWFMDEHDAKVADWSKWSAQ